MADFFQSLVETKLVNVIFLVGAAAFILAIVGRVKDMAPSLPSRVVLVVFGLFLMVLSLLVGMKPPPPPPGTTPSPVSTSPILTPSSRSTVLEAGMTVMGPASLHAYEGSHELANALQLVWTPYWGSNVPAGRSVVIPATVTLAGNNQVVEVKGTVRYYASNEEMVAAEQAHFITPTGGN